MKWKLETPIGRYRVYENAGKWYAEYPYVGINGKGDPIIHIAKVQTESEKAAISHCENMWDDFQRRVIAIK